MIEREDQLLQKAGGWTDWRDFRVSRKIQESSEITSFYLVPVDGKLLPSYLPGQYISVRLSIPDLHYLQARQYSLSDAPHPEYYRISVKKEPALDLHRSDATAQPGYISNILHEGIEIGDVLQVSHPAGIFFLDTRKDGGSDGPIVLISAGVGLTPNLAILNTLNSTNSKRKISWIHAARSSRVQAFGPHIHETVNRHNNVQSFVFNKEPGNGDRKGIDYHFQGRLSLNKLDSERDLFIHDPRTEYFISGPDKFMADMGGELSEWGVGRERIRMEVFGTGERPTS